MSIHLDGSDGKPFVRFTSDDPRESVEQFLAERGLVGNWPALVQSSTGVINGHRFAQLRLPLAGGPVPGKLPDHFARESLLASLQAELQGDGFVQVLRSDLEAGYGILRVSFADADGEKPARYAFWLFRLGGYKSLEVPAGGLAIEGLLRQHHQRLESLDAEARRLCFLLRQACEPFAALGDAARQIAVRHLISAVGGPLSRNQAERTPWVEADQPWVIEPIAQLLKTALLDAIVGLIPDSGAAYVFGDVAEIVDQALARLVSTG
jgi:hypothetical protein